MTPKIVVWHLRQTSIIDYFIWKIFVTDFVNDRITPLRSKERWVFIHIFERIASINF